MQSNAKYQQVCFSFSLLHEILFWWIFSSVAFPAFSDVNLRDRGKAILLLSWHSYLIV